MLLPPAVFQKNAAMYPGRHKYFFVPGLLLGLIVFLAFLPGCAGLFTQHDLYATGDRLSSQEASQVFKGKLCVLGAGVPGGRDGYQTLVSDLLGGVLRKQAADSSNSFQILGFSEFLNQINQKTLLDEYLYMTDVYRRSGIYPKESLQLLQSQLGIGHFIKPALLQLDQRSDTRLSVFSLRLIVTKETTVRVSAEIWNTRTGRKSWNGTAGCIIAGEKLSQKRIVADKAIYDAWEKMAARLFEPLLAIPEDNAGRGQTTQRH